MHSLLIAAQSTQPMITGAVTGCMTGRQLSKRPLWPHCQCSRPATSPNGRHARGPAEERRSIVRSLVVPRLGQPNMGHPPHLASLLLSPQAHSHSLTITCTCCCDGIYGAQDLKISHAHSLILSDCTVAVPTPYASDCTLAVPTPYASDCIVAVLSRCNQKMGRLRCLSPPRRATSPLRKSCWPTEL